MWPIKSVNAFFCLFCRQKQNIPTGYTVANEPQRKLDWGWLNPAGGMFSSVADLAKVKRYIMGTREYSEEFSYSLYFICYYLFVQVFKVRECFRYLICICNSCLEKAVPCISMFSVLLL